MPDLGCDDAMWINDPHHPSPSLTDVTIDAEEIASGLTKDDRLAMVREWVGVKERELARRRDARFVTTCFIPIPNELSAKDAVRVGHEMGQALFNGDHLYSFSVHAKESVVRRSRGTPWPRTRGRTTTSTSSSVRDGSVTVRKGPGRGGSSSNTMHCAR